MALGIVIIYLHRQTLILKINFNIIPRDLFRNIFKVKYDFDEFIARFKIGIFGYFDAALSISYLIWSLFH